MGSEMLKLWCKMLEMQCEDVSEEDKDYFGCGMNCEACEESEETDD